MTGESHAVLEESQGLARLTGRACRDHLGEKNAWCTAENGNPFPSLGSDDPALSHISKAPFETRGTHAAWRFPHHRGTAHPTRKTSAENFERVCVCAQLCLTPVTPWTVARQAPLSMGIVQARILKWVAISFCRGSSKPRIEPPSSAAPALQAGSSPLSYPGSLRILSKRQPADSSWMLMM